MSFFSSIITRHAKWVVAVSLLLALIAGVQAVRHLKFDTNQDNLISRDHKYFKDYVRFLKNFGDWEFIYVVIEVPENKTAHAKNMADALVRDLKSRPDLFATAHARVDVTKLFQASLLYLDVREFDRALTILREKKSTVREFLAIRNVEEWYHWLSGLFEDQQLGNWTDSQIKALWPLIKSGLFAPHDDTEASQMDSARLIQKLSGQYADPDGYFFSDDGKLLFVQVMPHKNYSRMEIIGAPLDYLRERQQHYKSKIKMGITGRPVLQDDEARTTGEDSQWSGLLSLVLVTVLYLVAVRRAAFALLGVFSLFVALTWTLGFVSLTYGQVNLLTVSFTVILTGLGIDYGIHFLIRYLVLQKTGVPAKNALIEVSQRHSPAILLGAMTSAVAFSSSWFSDFEGLRQLGTVVGVGIILCALSQLVLFPALLSLFAKSQTDSAPALRSHLYTRLSLALLSYPKLLLAAFFIFLILGLPQIFNLKMDHNLLALQDQELESVRYEKIIRNHSRWSTWFLVKEVADQKSLKQLEQKMGRLESVIHTESINTYLPEQQEKRAFAVKTLAHDILRHDRVPASLKKDGLVALKELFQNLANRAFSQGMAEEFSELSELSAKLDNLSQKSSHGELSPSPVFLKNLKNLQQNIRHVLNPENPEESDLPAPLLKRLKGKDNKFSLTIYPRHDIWEWQALETFISEVRKIIPDVTGAPVTTYESAIRLNRGFGLVGAITLAVVGILVFWYFKNWRHSVLVFLSLMTSLAILVLVMVGFKININLANFFALPVLIGTGVDHTIHILHDLKHKNHWKELFDDTLPAVTLSCLTTILSFGTLAFVRHNGLASFGQVMTIGSTAIFLVNSFGLVAWLSLTRKN